MDIPIEHDSFSGRGLALRPSSFWRGPQLLIDGAKAAGSRGRFSLRDNLGKERQIRLKSNRIDPIPRVEIDGASLQIARPLTWYEYAWISVPILLAHVGGALGALFGILAAYSSARVFRSNRPPIAKYGISALISGCAVLAFLTLATLVQLLVRGPSGN